MNEILRTLLDLRDLEERFRKIIENPGLNGAEHGFTAEELEKLEKLIGLVGEAAIAGNEIAKKYL